MTHTLPTWIRADEVLPAGAVDEARAVAAEWKALRPQLEAFARRLWAMRVAVEPAIDAAIADAGPATDGLVEVLDEYVGHNETCTAVASVAFELERAAEARYTDPPRWAEEGVPGR